MSCVPADCEMRAVMPATLEAVERFCGEVRRKAAERCHDEDRFAIELLLREALANAVLHGANQDASRRVRCVVRIQSGVLEITVADPGQGFDWQTARDGSGGPLASDGRGLDIYRLYATSARFNRKGNRVRLTRKLIGRSSS